MSNTLMRSAIKQKIKVKNFAVKNYKLSNNMTYLWLTLASIVGWFISTLAGGGSSFILMPIVGLFLGTVAIPPIITTGGILGNAERAFVYRQKINFTVIYWELPGTIVGGCLGAFMLTQIPVRWLSFFCRIISIYLWDKFNY